MADEGDQQIPLETTTPTDGNTVSAPEVVQNEATMQSIDASPDETAQIPESEPLASEPEPVLVPTPDSTSTPQASAPPVAAPATTVVHAARDLLVKARATIQFRKTAKLEKIMVALQKKNHITNDEVEKLLHVSDATASRYLSTLVKQGKLKQVGKTGKAVTYTKP